MKAAVRSGQHPGQHAGAPSRITEGPGAAAPPDGAQDGRLCAEGGRDRTVPLQLGAAAVTSTRSGLPSGPRDTLLQPPSSRGPPYALSTPPSSAPGGPRGCRAPPAPPQPCTRILHTARVPGRGGGSCSSWSWLCCYLTSGTFASSAASVFWPQRRFPGAPASRVPAPEDEGLSLTTCVLFCTVPRCATGTRYKPMALGRPCRAGPARRLLSMDAPQAFRRRLWRQSAETAR